MIIAFTIMTFVLMDEGLILIFICNLRSLLLIKNQIASNSIAHCWRNFGCLGGDGLSGV